MIPGTRVLMGTTPGTTMTPTMGTTTWLLARRTSAEKDTCQMVVTPSDRRERIRRQLLKA